MAYDDTLIVDHIKQTHATELLSEREKHLVGLAVTFVAIISGVITHRRIFADFFTFRTRRGQRSWLDAHNAVAVLALPFHLMITYTGLVTLLFLAMNGHLVVLEVLAESFTTLPIGESLGRMDFQALVLRFSWVMAAAILIGMPAITALLIVNISFGVMMRAAPQLNIFSIGFPLTLVFGLFIMWVMMGNVLGQYQELASDALIWLRGLVRAS